jgi:hypothetical protein
VTHQHSTNTNSLRFCKQKSRELEIRKARLFNNPRNIELFEDGSLIQYTIEYPDIYQDIQFFEDGSLTQ